MNRTIPNPDLSPRTHVSIASLKLAPGGRSSIGLSRRARNWLVMLSDPLRPPASLPPTMLPPDDLNELFAQAESQGVLAIVLRNFQSATDDARYEPVIAAATARHRNVIGLSLMIEHRARALLRQVREQDLPATVVKGPIFARRLYSEKVLRRFTDLDVLVAPEAIGRLEAILRRQGFELAEEPRPAAREWKWVHRDYPDVMVEVQCDLVHAPSLRAAMSLAYRDLVLGRDSAAAARPAALLVTAAIHGSCHQYERLLHVLDMCQAARLFNAGDDLRELKALIGRTGARFAAVTGLQLAGRIFSEPRCLALARALGPVRHAALAGRLIDRSVIASSMGRGRWMHSWRRSAYRALLKRGRPGPPQADDPTIAGIAAASPIGDAGA